MDVTGREERPQGGAHPDQHREEHEGDVGKHDGEGNGVLEAHHDRRPVHAFTPRGDVQDARRRRYLDAVLELARRGLRGKVGGQLLPPVLGGLRDHAGEPEPVGGGVAAVDHPPGGPRHGRGDGDAGVAHALLAAQEPVAPRLAVHDDLAAHRVGGAGEALVHRRGQHHDDRQHPEKGAPQARGHQRPSRPVRPPSFHAGRAPSARKRTACAAASTTAAMWAKSTRSTSSSGVW